MIYNTNTIPQAQTMPSGSHTIPQEVALTGTITSLGRVVTGTGTMFTKELLYSGLPMPSIAPNNYIGTWDSAANMPTLAQGVGVYGDWYRVSENGQNDLLLGYPSTFQIGDIVIYIDNKWTHIRNHIEKSPLKHCYLWNKAACEIRRIMGVVSDSVLIISSPFTTEIAGAPLEVPDCTKLYHTITLCLGAGTSIGTDNLPKYTSVNGGILTFSADKNVTLPICYDGEIDLISAYN